MQKILIAIDALNFDAKGMLFATYIARLNQSKLIGVFLENLVYEPRPSIKRIHGLSYVEEITSVAEESPKVKEQIKANMQLFKDICAKEEVPAIVHLDRGVVLNEILIESRFADMIIVDPGLSFNTNSSSPSRFLKELLAGSECPVIITPTDFTAIDEVIFGYDGSKSAAQAIKQFCYLFPTLADKMVTILQVAEKEDESYEEHREKLSEWLTMHFSKVSFEILYGSPSDELFKYLFEKTNKLLVIGAYGRNFLSRLFKPSTADIVLKSVDIPLFIAHSS